MNRIELLQSLFVLSIVLFANNVLARLKGEGILGGDDAAEGQFGYSVSFQTYDSHICGGSIIAERYIVTAAHCVVGGTNKFYNFGNMTVVAGIADLNAKSKRKVSIEVEEIFVTTDYDPLVMVDRKGDIAVLKLKEDLNLEKHPYLSKLELPNEDDSYEKVTATVTGFGINEVDVILDPLTNNEKIVGHRSFNKMRYAKVNVEEDRDKKIFARIVQRDPSKPEGICDGDSGSGLVYDNTLIGVASGAAGDCRDDRQPAVYTRVASYVRFIRKVLSSNIDEEVRRFVPHKRH